MNIDIFATAATNFLRFNKNHTKLTRRLNEKREELNNADKQIGTFQPSGVSFDKQSVI